jgi:ParB family chromosome partitioning protein
MRAINNRGLFDASRIVHIKICDINADRVSQYRDTRPGVIRELAGSISKYGVLQPVSVRRSGAGYELISGERRLRAAALAGLEEVPCIVMEASEQDSAVLVLVDNLQRRGLDFIEEARALSRLINLYGYSQDEAARLTGRSQPAVANKLRLLKLPDSITGSLRAANLTERHARALLRLLQFGERAVAEALAEIIRQGYNVAQTDEYIDKLISCNANATAAAPPVGRGAAAGAPRPESQPSVPKQVEPVALHGHIRFFANTVRRGIKLLQQAGIKARCDIDDEGGEIRLTITLPKGAA